ncbi:MAG: hypothetical protein M0R51_12005 [Clostridia bacterium]|jgi:hypothetical protein|nr:hypothetical protein [Clostridia bacterium]
MKLKVIKNQLKPYKSLHHKTFFVMIVNDMKIMGYKSRDRNVPGWLVYIYHEDKITDKKIYKTSTETVAYLNAYIEVARTPVKWYVQ